MTTNGEEANVVDKSGRLGSSQLGMLCQRALLLPYEARVRSVLSERIQADVPETISYSSASVKGFRHIAQGSTASCSGMVSETDIENDVEELALRAIWALSVPSDSDLFGRLSELIDDRRDMDNDILVYLANEMPPSSGKALTAHLRPERLKLPASRRTLSRLRGN
jgi:hypothetical protein